MIHETESLDEFRQRLERLVMDAHAKCKRSYVRDGRIWLEGPNADEHLVKLEKYQANGCAAKIHDRLFPPPNFATQELHELVSRLRLGQGDVLYSAGDTFKSFECGPGKITALGAPPGAGKTALAMQYVFDALAADSQLRVAIANAEMPFNVLLRREITRRSSVPAKALRFANLTTHQMAKVEAVASELEPLIDRIDVMSPPFTLKTLQEFADKLKPSMLVLDYLQKFASGDDARMGVNAVMSELRYLCLKGWGVLALSATTRGKGKAGSSHDSNNLSLASFKESGEIEFNADSCYLLRDEGPLEVTQKWIRKTNLDCVKNRHGEQESIPLVFDMSHMSFRPPQEPEPERHSEFDEYESTVFPFTESHDDGSVFEEASF